MIPTKEGTFSHLFMRAWIIRGLPLAIAPGTCLCHCLECIITHEFLFFLLSSVPQSARHSATPMLSGISPISTRSNEASENAGRTPIDIPFERRRESYWSRWIWMLSSFTRRVNSRSSDLTWKNRQPKISPAGSSPYLIPVLQTAETFQPQSGFIFEVPSPSHSPWAENIKLMEMILSRG